jgi:nucleoside permease NupC
MDKRISTLIFIYVIYLLIILAMLFSTNGQKVLTRMIFGGGGLALLFTFFFLWLGSGKEK